MMLLSLYVLRLYLTYFKISTKSIVSKHSDGSRYVPFWKSSRRALRFSVDTKVRAESGI